METSKEQWNSFEREWTACIVESVNTVRSSQGLTVNDLAARLRHLGWPVSNATLSGILSGNKRSSISVAEVTILARALSTSPLYLIFGLPHTEELPAHQLWLGKGPAPLSIYNAAGWFFGINNPKYSADEARSSESRSTALATRNTIYFIERTSQLSDMIWDDVAKLIALSELESIPQEWKTKVDAETRSSLNRLATSLRRIRARHREDAQESPLADIGMLPLPDAFSFVDSDESIEAAMENFSASDVRARVSENHITNFKRRLLKTHDAESEESLRLEGSM